MTAKAFDLGTSGLIAGVAGAMSIVGPLLMAFILDRHFAPPIAALILFAAAVALPFLGESAGLWIALLAAASVRLTVGAKVDLLAYITSRYFGLQVFGKLFGVLFACV